LRGAAASAAAVPWRPGGTAARAPAGAGGGAAYSGTSGCSGEAAPGDLARRQGLVAHGRLAEPAAGAGEEPDCATQAAEAYRRGRAEGEAAAARLAEERAAALAAPVLANFGALVQELASARRRLRQEAEESLVELALAIARRILHRELAIDPEAILGLVRSGFDRLNARELYRLRLAPADAEIVARRRGELGIPQAVEIAPDATLPAGSAIFETARGELDVSLQTQLEEIERGFADVLARRRRG
jgi:flagellar assembly protein FliH